MTDTMIAGTSTLERAQVRKKSHPMGETDGTRMRSSNYGNYEVLLAEQM